MGLELLPGGRFRLLAAPQEIGQGNGTIYQMMAAEELDVDLAAIELIQGDTGLVPDGGSVTASRGTYAGGAATVSAAQRMLTLLRQGGADLLNVAVADVAVRDGRVVVGSRSVTFAEIYQRLAETGRPLREVVMVPVVAAIPNAIAQAIGARVWQLPATPERIWRAMRERERSLRQREGAAR